VAIFPEISHLKDFKDVSDLKYRSLFMSKHDLLSELKVRLTSALNKSGYPHTIDQI